MKMKWWKALLSLTPHILQTTVFTGSVLKNPIIPRNGFIQMFYWTLLSLHLLLPIPLLQSLPIPLPYSLPILLLIPQLPTLLGSPHFQIFHKNL